MLTNIYLSITGGKNIIYFFFYFYFHSNQNLANKCNIKIQIANNSRVKTIKENTRDCQLLGVLEMIIGSRLKSKTEHFYCRHNAHLSEHIEIKYYFVS